MCNIRAADEFAPDWARPLSSMCLVTTALGVSARYPFVLAANRDELHARPTLPAHWWEDQPHILGGRDRVAGGSWLAVDRQGRVACVTNFRERPSRPAPRSRGWLVRDFLSGRADAEQFAASLEPQAKHYGAFNLLLKDAVTLHYASNRATGVSLPHGVHVLSNARLGTPWPKIDAARRGMQAALDREDLTEALLELLAVRDAGGDPATFDPHARALFIEGAEYGTRSSTVILVSADQDVAFTERRFDAAGTVCGETRHAFALEHAP